MTMSAMLPGAAGPSSSSSSSHLSSTPLAGGSTAQAAASSSPACITVEELVALLEGKASSSLEALASRGSEPHEGSAGPTPTARKVDAGDGDDSRLNGDQASGSSSRPVVVGRPEAQQYLAFPATSAKDGDGRGDGGGDGRDPGVLAHHYSPRTIDDGKGSRNSKARLGGEAKQPRSSSLPPPAPIGSPSREAVHNGNDNGINQRPSAASSSPSNRTSLLSPYLPPLPPLPPPYHSSNPPLTAAVRASGTTRRKLIIFDLRPLDAFLQARITGSINLALPSLVVRRMRRSALASLSKATTSTSTAAPSTHHLTHLSDYITTTSGKRKFEQALESLSTDDEPMSQRSPRSPLDLWRADIVVVVPPPSTAASSSSSAATSSHEASRALCEALESLECPPHQARGRNTLFRGDLASMLSNPSAAAFVERGAETAEAASTVDAAALDVPPQSEAGPSSLPPAGQDASAAPAPAPPPKKPPTRPKARPGRPSLARLDTGEKVQTLGSLGAANGSKAAAGGGGYNSAPLRLGATNTSLQVPPSRTAFATPVSGASAEPATMSLQGLAHMQAKLPPSPASFGDMSLPLSPVASSSSRLTSSQAGRELARRGSDQTLPSPATTSQGTGVAAAAAAAAGFDVSTVVPSFLYLGPDITTAEEAAQLRSLGIRRILNCAAEVSDKSRLDDTAGSAVISPLTCLGTPFDRYLKIPMWDNVEAAHVQEDIEQACIFLDEARAANAPVYVHCRAGKSRSVSVVMGWLIHAYKWPLKRAYDYVSERRKDVSPNIGFISCLMAFEELRLRGGGGEGGGELAGSGALQA